jgi:hypothetical protein
MSNLKTLWQNFGRIFTKRSKMAPKPLALAENPKPNGGIFNWEISWKTLARNRYTNEFSNFGLGKGNIWENFRLRK